MCGHILWRLNKSLKWYIKRRKDLVILDKEEEGVLWYYDILKFLELGIYLENVGKKERYSMRLMVI